MKMNKIRNFGNIYVLDWQLGMHIMAVRWLIQMPVRKKPDDLGQNFSHNSQLLRNRKTFGSHPIT